MQILKALVLGEEERGQSQYQVMCYIVHFTKDDFISSDAMSKLRQKNPGTIRTPEEEKPRDNYTMDYTVDLSRSNIFSPHINDLCSEASEASYTRNEDIQMWAQTQGKFFPWFAKILLRKSSILHFECGRLNLSSRSIFRLEFF